MKNHTRLSDTSLEVGAHLVLIGPNNSGKSALLRLLSLALAPSMSGLYQQLGPGDVRDKDEALELVVEFDNLKEDELAAFPDAIIVTDTGERHLGIIVRVEVEDTDTSSIEISRTFSDKPTLRPSRKQLELIGWRYIPATRSISGENVVGRGSAFRSLLADVELGSDRERLLGILNSFDSELAAAESLAKLRESLARHLSTAMPRRVSTDDLQFYSGGVEGDDVLANVGISLKGRDGEPDTLASQSDGTRSLIAMTFYDYSATSASIVAIDEPENHLHPSAQRALADLLKAGDNQKILATHSPAIVQRFDPEHVGAFDTDGNARSIPKGALSSADKLIAQWWTSSRLEPLTARYVFVVEGDSDRLFLEFAARAFDVALDRLGISIFDLGGAGEFGNAYRIFGAPGFNVDLRGLVDQDAQEKWAKALGVDTDKLHENGITVCSEDLEQEYIDALGVSRVRTAFEGSGLFTANELGSFPAGNPDYSQIKPWFKGSGKKTRAAIALGQVLGKTDYFRVPAVRNLLAALAATS